MKSERHIHVFQYSDGQMVIKSEEYRNVHRKPTPDIAWNQFVPIKTDLHLSIINRILKNSKVKEGNAFSLKVHNGVLTIRVIVYPSMTVHIEVCLASTYPCLS